MNVPGPWDAILAMVAGDIVLVALALALGLRGDAMGGVSLLGCLVGGLAYIWWLGRRA